MNTLYLEDSFEPLYELYSAVFERLCPKERREFRLLLRLLGSYAIRPRYIDFGPICRYLDVIARLRTPACPYQKSFNTHFASIRSATEQLIPLCYDRLNYRLTATSKDYWNIHLLKRMEEAFPIIDGQASDYSIMEPLLSFHGQLFELSMRMDGEEIALLKECLPDDAHEFRWSLRERLRRWGYRTFDTILRNEIKTPKPNA